MNRDKVINGLQIRRECVSRDCDRDCEKCDLVVQDREWLLSVYDDAIALLKEQKPVKAVADGEDSYICNNCGTVIGWTELDQGGIEEVKYRFCPECGRAVKWE